MKRLIWLLPLLVWGWMAVLPAAADAAAERPVLSTSGRIESINDRQVTVSGQGAFETIILYISPATYLRDGIDGQPLELAALRPGDAVTAYYGPVLTKSLPPQGQALALLVGGKGSERGKYLAVAAVEPAPEQAVRVLNSNRDMLVTLRPEMLPDLKRIKKRSELIVWYDMVAMSMPGQTAAEKAVLLPARPDLRVHTGAGVIVVDGRELPLAEGDLIVSEGDKLLLPLRIVAESLGYSVEWLAEPAGVRLLEDGREAAVLTIGSDVYAQRGESVRLPYAPELTGGKTLVPLQFFREVLGLQVEVNSGHI
ncbi:MAG: copper amine oxidase N-terminal domain-containing protein [Sporomusaceae bacterium]|nr:copper amine oxidase N-terminal domain-containing protein [Sporomusaceae bacterium]